MPGRFFYLDTEVRGATNAPIAELNYGESIVRWGPRQEAAYRSKIRHGPCVGRGPSCHRPSVLNCVLRLPGW